MNQSNKTYTLTSVSALQNLQGESIKADGRLRVSDHAGADQGKLNRWALKMTRLPQ